MRFVTSFLWILFLSFGACVKKGPSDLSARSMPSSEQGPGSGPPREVRGVLSFTLSTELLTNIADFMTVGDRFAFVGNTATEKRVAVVDSLGKSVITRLDGYRPASDLLRNGTFSGISLLSEGTVENGGERTFRLFGFSAEDKFAAVAGAPSFPEGDRYLIGQIFFPESKQLVVSTMSATANKELELEIKNVSTSSVVFYKKADPEAATWASGPLLDAGAGVTFHAAYTLTTGKAPAADTKIVALRATADGSVPFIQKAFAQSTFPNTTLHTLRKAGESLYVVADDTDGLTVWKLSTVTLDPDAKYAGDGSLKLRRSADTIQYFPQAAKIDEGGRVWACGQVHVTPEAAPVLAVWRYTADGRFDTQLDEGKPYRVLGDIDSECVRLATAGQKAAVLTQGADHAYQVFVVE